ncbi:PAS domain-containing protein [Robiginitalea aurantiaca]|uniref:PAS domain-containing protein n=1 Tax=Robiginitalea aurantiaca TaxID=3056915 RepID=A0ABT7WBA8_9FLAO|nr:PAS domain-containing protein [Robiginitalea aurantiaca]MDM9630114.1 PAS domain-containing protein [Robiginitalea aurantiaca]
MSGHAIELILSRQLADCLSVPVFIVDPKGNLLFYNTPAEQVLGKKFEDTGQMSVGDWGTSFNPHDEEGNPIPPEGLPLVQTIKTELPAHRTFWINSLENKSTRISVTSIPIIGRSEVFSGAMAIFWDNELHL